jgi:hypothetical protein
MLNLTSQELRPNVWVAVAASSLEAPGRGAEVCGVVPSVSRGTSDWRPPRRVEGVTEAVAGH